MYDIPVRIEYMSSTNSLNTRAAFHKDAPRLQSIQHGHHQNVEPSQNVNLSKK